MKFVVGENGRNPVKNLPRPRFVHHETHMEGPRRKLQTPAVGGRRQAPNRLCHEAALMYNIHVNYTEIRKCINKYIIYLYITIDVTTCLV